MIQLDDGGAAPILQKDRIGAASAFRTGGGVPGPLKGGEKP